uniref:Phyllomedusin n=1 Tax=Phyllomedusa bicolor TaxID=8393 RepID=TKN_PHYBI|nr:RecName: Full=Phyllomedusin [Phyllomedusa bicolor]
QNPNRFIGLM